MKKMLLVLIAIFVSLALVGCGSSNTDPTQVINRDKNNKTEQKNETEYYVMLGDNKVVVGEPFVAENYPDYNSLFQIPSCAFGGNDNVYQYDDIEVTTYCNNDQELVYSIFFVEPTASTEKGISLGDEVAKVYEQYGNQQSTSYTSGDVKLVFVVENDIVTAVEYTLITE